VRKSFLIATLLSAVAFAQTDELTPLLKAVQENNEKSVAELLQKGADPNAVNRYGITPLWLAATNASAPMVRTLLKAGANPKATLPHGETALMTAARTGEPETIKALLDAGSDPNAKETQQGESALIWAAAENHPDAIRTLIAGGADPNQNAKSLDLAPMKWMNVGMVDTLLPRGGFTAIMYAARQDAQDAVRALADSGADVDAHDADGATALQLAIINEHYDMAALLIEKGANPNTADNNGMTGLYAAVDMLDFRSDIGRPKRKSQDKLTALDIVKLSLKHGANPNAQLKKPIIGRHHGFGDNTLGEGATILMRAVKANDFDAMHNLLAAGANPALGMTNGSCPVLVLATLRGNTDKVIAMLRTLAEKGANLNAANKRGGDTALHIAVKAGNNPLVRALLELGADQTIKDSNGKTPLDVAKEETAAILKGFTAAAPTSK
jgi:uncharacterized protein